MELKGNLADVGLPFVLQTINMGKMTGTLHLKHAQDTGEIYFKNGKMMFATASKQRMRLGEILLNQGKITEQDIQQILTLQEIKGKKFGELLIRSGKITEEEVTRCLSFQAEDVIFQLMSLKEASYIFIKNNIPEDIIGILDEETFHLISEGKDRIDELLKIRETLPSMNLILELNPNPKKSEKELDLTIDEWQILSLVDGQRTVAQICNLSPANSFVTCRILNNLMDFDLLIPVRVKLFEGNRESDSAEILLRLTTLIISSAEIVRTIYNELAALIGSESLVILRDCVRDARENYPTLFSDIDLDENGSIDHLKMIGNILTLPQDQHYAGARNGLNTLLVKVVLALKDLLGKKKYHEVLRKVNADLTDLFDTQEKLRKEIMVNLQTVIKHTGQIPSSYKQAISLYNEKNFKEAYLKFSSIPTTNPNYKKAERFIKKIVMLKPDIAKECVQEEQSDAAKQIEQPVQILEGNSTALTEQEGITRSPQRSSIIKNLLTGLKHFSMGKFDDAITLLDKVLTEDPLNQKASKYRELAIQKLAKKYEEKIGSLELIPELNPHVSDSHLEQLTLSPHEGYLLSRVNNKYSINDIIGISGLDTYNALKIFAFFIQEELVILHHPETPQATVKAAPRETLPPEPQKGKPRKQTAPAATRKRKPTKTAPVSSHKIDRKSLAEQHYKQGLNALKEGDFARSVEELEAAILNDPNKPIYYSLLAEAREKKRASESGYHFEAGVREFKQQNYAKAVRLLRKAITNSPRNFQYLVTLADVLLQIPGKREESLKYYKRALDIEPNNVEIIIKVGQLYKLTGRKDLAIKAFRSCLSIDSHNQQALRELRRLQLAI